jgi:hypothetical protein
MGDWGSGADLAGHLHLQPCRRGLEQRHVTLTPLVSGQQLDRLGRRHLEGRTDLGGRGDAAVSQWKRACGRIAYDWIALTVGEPGGACRRRRRKRADGKPDGTGWVYMDPSLYSHARLSCPLDANHLRTSSCVSFGSNMVRRVPSAA